jgi:hypothetical protein
LPFLVRLVFDRFILSIFYFPSPVSLYRPKEIKLHMQTKKKGLASRGVGMAKSAAGMSKTPMAGQKSKAKKEESKKQ